ncbi:uncharacterized protein LOC124365708 [Homalodisca vitripennis]|uniref:uncharacterized protein LOC124365708 n=1 Tax=Homalodisca vitripennis TaxID=197043 RepID=UPI001EEC1DA3|nr:uncharacterized protein LOC124365708 [Homalodisca vitripennis]XP_046677607.1 uncharacterized protein LOC124365708 [Homalodisca vitripennis]
MAKKETDFYPRWIQLLRAGNFQTVNKEVEAKKIDGRQALGCIVALSQFYYDATKGTNKITSTNDAVYLTKRFSTNFEPDKSNTYRYLTSLYHIINFLCEKNDMDQMAKLLDIVVEFKNDKLKLYETEGKPLHDHFINIFVKALKKLVCKDSSAENLAVILSLLAIMWKLLVVKKTVRNGTVYLSTIRQGAQVLGKQNQKAAVRLISAGLKPLYDIETVEDLETCLPQLFKVYSNLYNLQFKISGHHSALLAVRSHLDLVKWKCSQQKVHAECFMILCNATKLFMWDYEEPAFTKKVQDNIDVLTSFQGLSKNDSVNAACSLMELMLMNMHRSPRKESSVLSKGSLKPFLQMLLLLYGVFDDSGGGRTDHMKCLTDIFRFVINMEETQRDRDELKQCVDVLVQARIQLITAVKSMISTDQQTAEQKIVPPILNCFAILIQVYKAQNLPEEIIILGKPLCRFICTLSLEVLKDPGNQRAVEVMFTLLVSALGTERLDDALEALVAWLLRCPQDSKKVFKLWGNIKHNAVCDGKLEHLKVTVDSIVNKPIFEQNWFKCQLNSNEIGELVVEELKAYFKNTSLRGEPVVAAADALLHLSTKCITQVEGIVIAMDVASTTENFADQCSQYYSHSKSFMTLLRKEKKRIDPVQFNFCMGNLLYVQLLCEIRQLRKECESEMMRLSISPAEPLVAELPESRPDPNDICDVATKYSSLCLAEQRKLLDKIDTAMRHWTFASSILKEQENKDYNLSVTLSMVQGAGLLLRLYCDKVKQERIWKLLFDLATLEEDVNMIVTAVGEMLNVAEDIAWDMIDNTQKYLQQPELSYKVAHSFRLNLALYYMTHDKVPDGLKLLRDTESEEKIHSTLYTHFLLSVGQYQQRFDLKTYDHELRCTPSYHLSFHKALCHLLFLAEAKKWVSLAEACQIHSQMLVVSQLLGETYWALEQPREARCYLKTVLGLAQKLALPLRTVQLLLLLAWIDLSTGNVDDCAVKLEGLEDLLELCGTPVVYQGAPGSPRSATSRAVLSPPEYLDHRSACSCLPCTTEEYRRLVLETITLRGTFCANFGQVEDSLQCFKIAVRVVEDLSRSRNEEVLRSCARMWMRYADVLASTKKYEGATEANEKALNLMSIIKDPFISQHIIEQKISVQACQRQLQLQPIGVKISTTIMSSNTPLKSQIPQLMKTPKNFLLTGKSPLAVVNDNTAPITPFTRPVRPFRLPSSGDENTPPVSVAKSKRKVKQLPKFVKETPQPVHQLNKTRSSRTPFVIVDDDGNAVGVSGKKTVSKTSQKILAKATDKSVEAPKKRLFNTNAESSNLKSVLAVPINSEEDIVRKSNRKVGLKTYGRSKLPRSKVDSKLVNSSDSSKLARNKDGNGSVFDFNGMKNAIDHLENSFDSDIIEGTPPNNVTYLK